MSYVDYPWLRERRGIIYDALHLFVSPDGYRLSDRIWRTDQRTRNRIDELLAYEIRNGTAAVDIARRLEEFLLPGRELVRTRKPYGRDGSYDALRLARTEITAAAGRSTMAAAEANPFVRALAWRLSGSHPDGLDCECEGNATEDRYGLGPGVYPLDKVPRYPAHPHCLCNLQQVTVPVAAVVQDLRAWLAGGSNERMDGLFDLGSLLWHLQEMWGMLEFVRKGA